MNFYGIIPARYVSSRFPGKPLADINGKPMIQRVFEAASQTDSLKDVIVATDDKRIFTAVEKFGGRVVMTGENHKSGTDRCFEAAQNAKLEINKQTVIVNIQGDEPYINPEQIEQLISTFEKPGTAISTIIKKISDPPMIFDPNVVKCVFNKYKQAIYFSRNPIPFVRNQPKEQWIHAADFYKHLGIYAYRANILEEIVQLPPSTLERNESLEQLRWIENGYTISVEITEYESISVDTPEDVQKIK